MEKETEQRIQKLEQEIKMLKSFATIPFEVDKAFRERLGITPLNRIPIALQNAPLSTIADPSGGLTVDSQSRAAIGTIIDRLQALGLIS